MGSDIDALQLTQVREKLGAGDILLNCIDKDGTNSGFDLELVRHISENVSIQVIASSGAGKLNTSVKYLKRPMWKPLLPQVYFTEKRCPLRL